MSKSATFSSQTPMYQTARLYVRMTTKASRQPEFETEQSNRRESERKIEGSRIKRQEGQNKARGHRPRARGTALVLPESAWLCRVSRGHRPCPAAGSCPPGYAA